MSHSESTESYLDFMPTVEEMQLYKTKLDQYWDDTNPRKKINSNVERYDDYGRNISEQERRQNKVPWIKVKYRNGRLLINEDKKIFLRSMRTF